VGHAALVAMKQSLRKTPSHLHLAYKYGEPSGGLLGRNLSLEVEGDTFTLEVDISGNLKARNKASPWHVAANNLVRNHHKLKSLQCPDNLVRSRLIRAWESVRHPKLRVKLVLAPEHVYVYDVAPHSLFTGGVQLDVQAYLEEDDTVAGGHWVPVSAAAHDRNHA
jgi:hypothetical protein